MEYESRPFTLYYIALLSNTETETTVNFVEHKQTVNKGCDWLVQHNIGYNIYCHNYSIYDMVLYHYSDTANVLDMLKYGLCQPEAQETSMRRSHRPTFLFLQTFL